MFIAVLGVIVLIAGIVLRRSPQPGSRYSGIVTSVGGAIIALGLLLSIFKTIPPGKVGVQVLFGKVQDNVLESGLHIIDPLVDVTTFNIQT